MNGNSQPNEKRRYKPGLNVSPHAAKHFDLLWRHISWPIIGALVGALLIPSYPGQTKSSGLFDILFWVGCGTLAGSMVEVLVRWRRTRS